MSQLRTVTKTRPARGFGVTDENYEQLQVMHEFRIVRHSKKGMGYITEKIDKPKWEDVPHVILNGTGKR